MTDKPELTREHGYYIEVNIGSWEKEEGKDARHHRNGGIYRGSVTQDEAKRLLALVAYPEEPRTLSGGVAEGCVVPTEITENMRAAAHQVVRNANGYVNGLLPEIYRAMLSARPVLAPASPEGREWISVDERTPDTQYDVLITDGKFVGIGDCCKGHLWNIQSSINGPVTHWMPLPPAPTGAKERA